MGKRRATEIRMTFNYARTLVRKVSSYLFPAPVTFSVPDQGIAEAANRAEQVLQEVVARNGLAGIDFDLSVEAAVLGDAGVKVTWDGVRSVPVVAAVDPGSVVVQTSVDDPKRIELVAQRYPLTGAQIRRLFRDETESGVDRFRSTV